MSQNRIIALQSLLIFLQILNTGIATVSKDPLMALFISAGVGGFQYFVNHLGNHSIPPEANAVLTEQQKVRIAESGDKPPKVDSVPVVEKKK